MLLAQLDQALPAEPEIVEPVQQRISTACGCRSGVSNVVIELNRGAKGEAEANIKASETRRQCSEVCSSQPIHPGLIELEGITIQEAGYMVHCSAPAIKGPRGYDVHQCYVARHVLLQAVMLEDCGVRVTAQFFSQFAVVEEICHVFSQSSVTEDIHEQAVVAVLDHFLHGRSGGAHDGALGAHRFQ